MERLSTKQITQAVAEQDRCRAFWRAKRKCLAIILLTMAGTGFLEAALPADTAFYGFVTYGSGLLVIAAAMFWCYIDAEEHRFTISFRLSLLIFLLFFVGFPYYILRTRPNGPALKKLGLACLFFILVCIVYAIAYGFGCLIDGIIGSATSY